MPWAISSHVPTLRLSNTRTGMREARQATPDTPMPLLPRAATMPATWVPWPTLSDGSLSFWTKSQPASVAMFGARSGSSKLMPESTIATRTDSEPVVWFHASGASMPGRSRCSTTTAG